jgi:hypothetical protein
MAVSERQYMAVAAVPPYAEHLVLATGRYIGEGFDDPRLDTKLRESLS